MIKNIIYGGVYPDYGGNIKAINHKTKERVELTYHDRKSEKGNSYVTGKAYNSTGRLVYEITGSWLNEIKVKNVITGDYDVAW